MKPWFIKEDNVIPFPKKDKGVVRLPNVNAYPDFLTGVQDLQNHLKQGDISSDIHKKLYQDLIHRFMKTESFETPWFLREAPRDIDNEVPTGIMALPQADMRLEKDNITYANRRDLNSIIAPLDRFVKKAKTQAKVEVKSAAGAKRVPHIRILYLSDEPAFINALNKLVGGTLKKVNNSNEEPIIYHLSGDISFPRYYFDKNGLRYPIIFNTSATQTTTKGQQIQGVLIGKQELRPDKFFGVGAEFKSANDLANATIEKIKQGIAGKDIKLNQALIQLVQVANGQKNNIDLELLNYISANAKSRKHIEQDFGEILTPIMVSKENNQPILFPGKSNEAMVDVVIGGIPVAVKSLSGSGNSFDSIIDMIDNYEDEINKIDDENSKQKKLYNIIKGQRKSAGTVNDNNVRLAMQVPTKEAEKMMEVFRLTKPLTSYQELYDTVGNFLKQFDNIKDTKEKYRAYLEAIKPIAVAGNYAKKLKSGDIKIIPKGLPGDYAQYIKFDDAANLKDIGRETMSGFKSFEADFHNAAAKQLSYLLGVSKDSLYRGEGPDAKEMSQLITNIMRNKNAIAAISRITPDGKLILQKQSFKDLEFGYQYHAGTNTPNQNAPGYHIVFSK